MKATKIKNRNPIVLACAKREVQMRGTVQKNKKRYSRKNINICKHTMDIL